MKQKFQNGMKNGMKNVKMEQKVFEMEHILNFCGTM